jgi:hypothetical protein
MKHDWSSGRNLANNSCHERGGCNEALAEHGRMEGVAWLVDCADMTSDTIATVQTRWNAVRGMRTSDLP